MFQTNRVTPGKRLAEREAPRWLLLVAAIVGVTILVYFGYQALMGREGEPGPRMKVHPGMYDLRAAHQPGSAPHGR